jgi:outer membrane immunogenic protein
MKRILIVAAASLIAVSHVMAADLPVRTEAPAYYPAVAPIYDWGGGYIGINGGYAFGKSQWGSDPLNPSGLNSTGNFNVNGGIAGVTAGVSGQWGAWVLGAEGDFDWQGLKGTSASPFCTGLITSTAVNTATPPAPVVVHAPPAGLSCKTASTWLGTFRGRFGYAWDRVLVYGTAGVAGANVQTGLNTSRRRPISMSAGLPARGSKWRSPITGRSRSNISLSAWAMCPAITDIVVATTRRLSRQLIPRPKSSRQPHQSLRT